jgi:U6 snRNA-associated Sm-like protein LSm7
MAASESKETKTTQKHHVSDKSKPKKTFIMELGSYVGKEVQIKLLGGREIHGTLLGYDHASNLVIDKAKEYSEGYLKTNNVDSQRELGLIFVRGSTMMMIALLEGIEAIENPFAGENVEEPDD